MPKTRVSMRKIREVLRLTHELGRSVREVSKATGVGKTSVGEFVARAKVIGITWPIPAEINDADLEKRLFTPGDKLFVDWAGHKVPIIDEMTGEVHEAHIFVAALGASSYIYSEGRWTEKLPDWIGAHVNAFDFLGGVTKAVVPDNPKVAVIKPSRYEPGINRTYQDLADHYGFVVLPARVRRPRDKAKVENAVGIVSRYLRGKLRNRRFFSLEELNGAIRECLTIINARSMKRLNKSRNELFASIDQPALKPLPVERYPYADWKRCTVAPDYHVEVEKHYYSVPFRLLREVIEARYTDKTVELLHKGVRVASHVRSYVPYKH